MRRKINLRSKNLSAVIYALIAALLYGVNAPFSKLLLEKINPVFMAALLYLGAGLGIGIIYIFHDRSGQEKLTRQDLPYVIGMILLDSAAPILLMAGIKLGTSSGAALIGNFEIVATALFALLFFHEKISGVLCVAICFITISGLILSYDGGRIIFKGSLLAACATLREVLRTKIHIKLLR